MEKETKVVRKSPLKGSSINFSFANIFVVFKSFKVCILGEAGIQHVYVYVSACLCVCVLWYLYTILVFIYYRRAIYRQYYLKFSNTLPSVTYNSAKCLTI